MPSRRLEKVSKIVMETVSDVLQNRLADPRVGGMVSVTRVELAPDLRNANVFLSVLGLEEKQQKLCVQAVQHAHGFVQSQLARRLAMKTCPKLKFELDDSLKKGFDIMRLIDQVAAENAELERQRSANLCEETQESDDEG